jgi:tetratricopeptide (TPR) repeat protein
MQPSLEAPAAHLNEAVARKAAGDFDGALSLLLRTLELAPGWPEALYNLGNLLVEGRAFGPAAAAYRQALAGRPEWAWAWDGLGSALRLSGDLPGALEAHQKAVDLMPEDADLQHNLAVALQRLGREGEALAALREPRTPESHVARGLLLLKRGDLAAGWEGFEWREKPPRWRTQPVWRGEPLEGKTLLLSAEQGSGAQIQFLRFIPMLAQRGARILLETTPNLARLAATCPGVERVVALNDPCSEADFQIPLLSVARVLGTTLETIPAGPPYLAAPREPRPDLDAAFAPYQEDLKVGIAWNGNPRHPSNPDRSCSPADFAALADLPGVRLFGLQYGEEPGPGIVSLSGSLGDFASTAAAVERLDLVVTVDTCTAHLAGALGRPVWTLLHAPCDWRWLEGREDSPWYPGMRLFRQERPGDWSGVFARVRTALAGLKDYGASARVGSTRAARRAGT